jgi:hypothetical protein
MHLCIKDKLLFIPFKENGKLSFICILLLVLDDLRNSDSMDVKYNSIFLGTHNSILH